MSLECAPKVARAQHAASSLLRESHSREKSPTSGSRPSMPPRRSLSHRSSTASSPVRRRYIGWQSDSVSKRSRSSEALLLAWLTTPGNYARWRTQQHGSPTDSESRSVLCSEVNALLHSNGIEHRKDRDIYNKIQAMERSFAAAKKWLQETGLMPSFLRGNASADVDAHVAHLCKHYKELEPTFTATQNGAASEDVVDVTQRSSDEDEEEGEEEEEDEHEDEEKRVSGAQEREDQVQSEAQQEDTAMRDGDAEEDQTHNENTGIEAQDAEQEHVPTRRLSGGSDSVDDLIPPSQLSDNEEPPAASQSLPNEELNGRSEAQKDQEEEEDEEHSEATDVSAASVEPTKRKLFGKRSAGEKQTEDRPKKRSSSSSPRSTTQLLPTESPVSPLLIPTASPARSKVVKYAEAKPSIAPKRKTSNASTGASRVARLSETVKKSAAAKRTKTSTRYQSPDDEPLEVVAAVSAHPEALQALLRAVEEERVHRETLFQLECDKLLQELEEKKVKVAFKTALARKKLLDAGVAQSEIDRVLPV